MIMVIITFQVVVSFECSIALRAHMLSNVDCGRIVSPHMFVQIARCSECISTVGMGTFKWFLSRMDANMSIPEEKN